MFAGKALPFCADDKGYLGDEPDPKYLLNLPTNYKTLTADDKLYKDWTPGSKAL